MCNITSLAMALETLGIENPKPKEFAQFEDYLEDIRRQYVDKELEKATTPAQKNAIAKQYHREQRAGWELVARMMGAEVRTLSAGGNYLKRHWWESTVLPELSAGNAVMMSITGHIVRVQGMNDKGLIVDDPFGKVVLQADTRWQPIEFNARTSEDTKGEDRLWTWQEVERHSMAWVALLKRAGTID